jgi:TolA-binding protein
MVLLKKLSIYITLLIIAIPAFSQESAKFKEIDKEFRKALHLFDVQQYNAAYHTFENVNEELIKVSRVGLSNDAKQLMVQAEYYMAICDLELYHTGAENKLMAFVERYPENPLSKTASFELGSFYYRQRNFSKTIEWYEKTDVSLLSKSVQNEFYFRYGYSLFENDKFEQASDYFEKLIDKNSKYSYPAAYYDGIIQYNAKNYASALTRFEFVKQSKTYADIAPYYICKIYYDQQKYSEVLSNAAIAIQNPSLKNINDIYLMAGASAFNLTDWNKTIEYYELAAKKTSLTDLANYELGYALFQNQLYQKSIDYLKFVADKKTPYSQHALYILGQSFYQLKDKPSARNAFGKAAKLNQEKFLTASSLLNYAKLSYELNFYQTAIESFQDYIDAYPESTDAEDAQALLGEALLFTRNYKLAIEILDKIQPRTKRANIAYQKVSYYRGIELFNEGKPTEAIRLFNQSLNNPLDKSIQSYAWYWKAEAYYQQNNYDEALKYFSLFEQSDIKFDKELHSSVNYQLGYTYFKKEDYKSSIVYFDRFLKAEIKLGTQSNTKRYNDAVLRLADGYFMIKEYDKALFSYNKIINDKLPGSDYSLFQKSMILGLQNKQNDKIVTLKQLLNLYPNSTYADDATYEIGTGYFVMNTIPDAIQYFLAVIQKYPNSRFVAKSRLNLGLIYYNESNDEKATEMYKAIITDYPGTEEAKEALLAIKNIYVDAGNADGYLNYVKTLPFASVSAGAQDSITYQAANNRYLIGDCENAINGFNNYIERFANGYFILEAHANRAECFLKTKKEKMALIDYEYMVSNSNPKYLERSLVQSARINFKLKEYEKAAKLYTQLENQAEFKENYLEAISGALKSYAALNDSTGILKYANKVITFEKSSIEDQYLANLYLARYYFSINNIEEADKYYRTVSKLTKTEYGAEAKYMLAQILFIKGKYLDAQQACFDLSNQVPAYEYWVAKGFIILAETYAKLGNDFQAKSTLESIIDEYSVETDGIIEEAKKKLNELTQPKQ